MCDLEGSLSDIVANIKEKKKKKKFHQDILNKFKYFILLFFKLFNFLLPNNY